MNRAINTTGSVIVNYRVVQKENDPPVYQLVRFERPAIETIATPGDIGFVLCDNLKSVEFTFQDSSGQKLDYWRQPEKEDEELTEVLLPSAVFIRLEFWEDVLKDTTISFQTAAWPVVAFFSGAEDG